MIDGESEGDDCDEVNQEESEQNLLQSTGLCHGELGFDFH